MNAPVTGAFHDLARIQGRLDRTPFNAWLGLRAVSASPDGVVFELEARQEFVSTPERQIVHGGVLASLLDAAAIYAVITATGCLQTTVDLRVDYHATAAVGVLRARGTLVRLGKTLSCSEARVEDHSGRLVASGRGTFLNLGLPA
ncbi:PaaI family thioesterase [Xanthobacter aminoxidans]|uniref:PaaI family thioesterase n=1 Tax=Xanthobacter aminoxidans TaxID=186280 RepID=UPI002022FA60|nr:PaaI family thioesterase [Xanthobacter aminoxidans]MCL8383482.1 PaaI family thioesterase [Xanthobacter aminoxidans]